MRLTPTESQEQIAIFEWAYRSLNRVPELRLLHAIPNGGARSARTGARLKKEGVKPGVPDICLPIPRGKYHGLYIELKAGKNKTSPEQKAWLDLLESAGYCAVCCLGSESAINRIEKYLKGIE